MLKHDATEPSGRALGSRGFPAYGISAGRCSIYAMFCLYLLALPGCETTPVEAEEDDGTPQAGTASITVSPEEATVIGIGNTILLHAAAQTADGEEVDESSLGWGSLNQAVATVDENGLVTAAGEGQGLITVSYQNVADTATITVETDETPPPPPSAEWDRVLADTTIDGDVVVPEAQAWLVGPNVEIEGNLRTVGGTIGMRPGSSLKFLGANPDEYVGGGMTFGSEFARDIGLWIGPGGVLDIRGTPKQGWNRTGTHSTWEADDEYWIAPTDVGDYEPHRWSPGQPIPQVDPRLPPTEVINVTRDIVIEGPGHIHIHSAQPQHIEYVQLRRMGVGTADGPVVGRYALHLHFNGDGSRGTIIRGVAAVNSGGIVFVPHESNGITMVDNVSVHSLSFGVWWDPDDFTHDLTIDRLLIAGVNTPKEWANVPHTGVAHASGTNMVLRNSVVAGSPRARGFHWSHAHCSEPHGCSWTFEDNVAHNNSETGINFWLNGGRVHLSERSASYRNRIAGLENGAYKNALRFADILLIDNPIIQHARSDAQFDDGGPARYTNVHVEVSEGPALLTGHMKAGGDGSRIEWIDCVLKPGSGQYTARTGTVFQEAPAVLVNGFKDGELPFLALFRHCGITPDDIEFANFPSSTEGTSIIIEHEDGRRWEVRQENGQKVVQEL